MKQRLINLVLRNILGVVVFDDVIKEDKKGNLYIGGNLITTDELKRLKEESKTFEKMRLWSVISETIKNDAYEKGWKNSTTMEQLNTAKTMFYTISLQQSIINKIKNQSI